MKALVYNGPRNVTVSDMPGPRIDRPGDADRGCECVGYQAHDPQGHEHPHATLNDLVRSVRHLRDLIQTGKASPSFSSRTSSRWPVPPRVTSISTPGTSAGPGSSCHPPPDRLRTVREWPCCTSGST
jgi:hypothetical protein